jgi:hypothetical protein
LNGTESLPPRAIQLPDKEFRSVIVTSTCVDGLVISANLCMSPCSTDYIFISFEDAWRVVSEDSSLRWPFLLIICTQHIVTAFLGRVMWDTQTFQHIAKFL